MANSASISKPKLAFFDIDGTLVGSSGIISERTKRAISTLAQQGVYVALATGRPLFGARSVAKELSINCYSLFSSGGLIANPNNNHVLFEARIAVDVAIACSKLAKELGLYVELYSQDNYFIETETDITAKHTSYLGLSPTLMNFDLLVKKLAIIKIVVISDNAELDAKQEILVKKMKGLISLCGTGASHPELTFNNITSPAASRVDGFHRIVNHLGISPQEVIAFGDAKSDLAFIELAGIGVAMIGAPQEVKDKADIIAEDPDNDGVAKVLEKLIE